MHKRSLREWSEVIAEQEKSGESQQAWCAARNININTYRDRKSTIKGQAKKEARNASQSEAKSPESWVTVTTAQTSEQRNEKMQVRIRKFHDITGNKLL